MVKYEGSLELNWINKDKSLLYEINEDEGVGLKPTWVDKNDIRVSEPRILKLHGEYGDPQNDNILIKGDNLLALRTLVELFRNRAENDKVKCIYIDPPFNTGSAFEHYDDNLEHSQWLTMMRDRLCLLRQLLRKDGVIFIHLDNNQIGYAQVILDEIFGRRNFLQLISIKKATTAGFKAINLCPTTVTEYILMYSKERDYYQDTPLFVETEYDEDYGKIITNPTDPPEKWEIRSLDEIILKLTGFSSWREAKDKWGSNWKDIRKSMKSDYALQNANCVISTKDLHKPSRAIIEIREISKKERDAVIVLKRDKSDDMFFYNGRCIAFYSSKLRYLNGKLRPTDLLTNFWSDVSWYGTAQEGDIVFKNSKKPERLIQRIIELSTKSKQQKIFSEALELFMRENEGSDKNEFIENKIIQSTYFQKIESKKITSDIVLDSFLGSGTTAAVAHKMGRRWIGIELGNHAETLCVPRLARVISGADQTGISKEIEWTGGGGFRYYTIGESVIQSDDMNWNLSYSELAKAVFMNYGFSEPQQTDTFEMIDNVFVGQGNRPGHFALCNVSKMAEIVKNDELTFWLNKLEDIFGGWVQVDLFTNKGVGIRADCLPENVQLKKIPESIMAKYGL